MPLLKSILRKTSSVKRLLVLFISSHLVLAAMMLFTFPTINEQIGTKAFDLQTLGYSMEVAQSIVHNLSEQVTQLYLFPQLTFLDLLYPVLLALFLSSLLFRLQKTTNMLGDILLIVPFIAMAFDYSENLCIILMISKSVVLSKPFVFLASTFTILKGAFTSIAWLAILLYTIKWVIWKARKNQPVISEELSASKQK